VDLNVAGSSPVTHPVKMAESSCFQELSAVIVFLGVKRQGGLGMTRYTVSDGKLVLTLEAAEEGGYVVTSPLDPELITQAETIEEAFANARDAAQALRESRVKLLRQLSASTTPNK
jgi:predicted RNase H-like HicB family nuclease